MYSIYQNLKSIEVKYGASYAYPTKTFIPLFNSQESVLKSIYISSSKLRLAWNKTFSNDDKTFNIEFVGDSNKFIERLKELCLKVVKKKTTHDHEIDLNQIKSYPNDAHTLRFYNVNISDVFSYDENGDSISIHDIVRDDQVKILFHFHGIIYKGMKVQIEMKLIQIMKMYPYSQVNKTMNMLQVPRMVTQKSSQLMPPPPPPPPACISRLPNNKGKAAQVAKVAQATQVGKATQAAKVARSSLSIISQEELLKAMAKLKKR